MYIVCMCLISDTLECHSLFTLVVLEEVHFAIKTLSNHTYVCIWVEICFIEHNFTIHKNNKILNGKCIDNNRL